MNAMRIFALFLFTLPLAAQESSPSESRSSEPADKYRLDMSEEKARVVRDNTYFPWQVKERELGKDTDLHMEETAYEDVLIHANKFPHDELEAHARRDVQFGDLIGSNRNDMRFELVRFEGRLLRLQKAPVTPALKLQGVENLYEAWVFPKNESTPVCLHITQLPEGLSPQTDLSVNLEVPVAVTGYFFKLLRYEQKAFNRATPGKHKVWAAPVLIGKSITVLGEADMVDAGMAWRMKFVPVAIGGFTLLALALAFVSWRYKRGDRVESERQREMRNKNPFENV